MALLNLDSLIPPDKEIQLNNKKYTISTNISTKLMLQFQQAFQGNDSNVTTEAMLEIIQQAFKKNHPEMTREILLETLNMQQMTALIQLLFSGGETEEKK
ncbi:MAG: hypothetical protein AB1567_04170 [bacterium]